MCSGEDHEVPSAQQHDFRGHPHGRLSPNGQERNRFDLTKPQHIVDLLNDFFAHVDPEYDRFDQAVQDGSICTKTQVSDISK